MQTRLLFSCVMKKLTNCRYMTSSSLSSSGSSSSLSSSSGDINSWLYWLKSAVLLLALLAGLLAYLNRNAVCLEDGKLSLFYAHLYNKKICCILMYPVQCWHDISVELLVLSTSIIYLFYKMF